MSFVIPVFNEQATIAGLLRDVRTRYPDCQLIVVDGGSSDRTVAEALPLCDQLLLGERGRARQMNLGGRAATAPYLFFLHADTRPALHVSELDAYLAQRPRWGFCRVRMDGARSCFRVIEWFMNQRSRLTSVATGDQMMFVEKNLFEQSGGFDDVPLMEDIAYCKRLRQLACPLVINQPVLTSSRRWETGGVIKTVVRMWLLRLAFFVGVTPSTLWRYYYGR
ncbi:MAG TPA: TIGR04283 family arsenosugar biosynthesis glycosyltransferase [Halioglobus sp.]